MSKSYRKNLHGGIPYYDDYNEDKKFVRIMYRPGYPLQAREVTQLQTILQNQVERLGDHFFEQGAVVNGGEIVESSAIAIRLTSSFSEEELKSYIGKSIKNDAGVRATIISYALKSSTLNNDQYQIIFANYTTGNSFSAGETLTIEGTLPLVTATIKTSSLNTPPPISVATNVISIASGIFYADGFLLKNDAGTIAASSGSTGGVGYVYRDYENPSTRVGFKIKRELITAEEDSTLKDPAFGFYNFNSPGADRYKIDLVLDQIALSASVDEDFFEVVRIIQGETTKEVRYTDYAILEDNLARRTYDESGHYTVSPFQVNTTSYEEAFGGSSSTQHAVKVSAGKAYVSGYEFETLAPSYYPIDRAYGPLHLETLRNVALTTPLKNYVTVLQSWDALYGNQRITYQQNRKARLQRQTSEGGSITNIGTCNIRTIQEMPGNAGTHVNRGEFRLWLFNINIDPGQKFSDTTHIAVIGDGSESDEENRYRIATYGSPLPTEIKLPGVSRQIFKAPIGGGLIETNRDDLPSEFIVKKVYDYDLSTGPDTIESDHSFLEGTSTNHIVYYTPSSGTEGATMLDPDSTMIDLDVNNATSPRTMTISIPAASAIPPGGKGTLIATQRWNSSANSGNIRLKSIQDTSSNTLSAIDAVGGEFDHIIELPHADVFEVVSITDDFRDVTGSFELDPNHTAEAYFKSRLVLKAGFTCGIDPNSDKIQVQTVSYKRFTHSGDGPFTVDSYPISDTFTYEDIPLFTDPETGETYSLADAYDFRPIAKDENSFDNGSGGPQCVACDNPASQSYVSYEHYLARVDKLVLNSDKTFSIVKGIPANAPQAPQTNENQMVLGFFNVPPYTISPDNIKYRHVDNQRTTMTEINEMEQSQQYDAYWSFVRDLEVKSINKAQGFRPDDFPVSESVFVDTFIGHNNAVTSKRDHNCSIDPEYGTLHPAFESSFHHMGLTGALFNGLACVKTSDNIYMLSSTANEYTAAIHASDTIKANQFGVPDFLGTLELSPSSDPYFSTVRKPKVIVNSIGEVDNWESNLNAYQRGRTRGFGSQWRDWETIWFGSVKRNDLNSEHVSSGSEYSAPRRSSFVSRILSDKLIKKLGNKIVDLSVVPYVRSRTITFTAKNLKPFTTHTLYFDGAATNIRDTTATDPNVLAAQITSDANGKVTGSFDIPRSVYLTGKKLVRITNNVSMALTTSSADAVYYAEGLLDTRKGDIFSVRPEITRRKAANSEDIYSDYSEANASNNVSGSFNSQTPFAQEIYVDPSSDHSKNGIMLKNIELFFRTKPTVEGSGPALPVKLSVRPMFNGSPHPYKVLPFSEVTKDVADVTVSNDYDAADGGGTTFEFSTPVFLRPGKSYAICIATNSPDYSLYMGVKGQNAKSGPDGEETETTIEQPLHINGIHLPLNNGSSYLDDTQYLKMYVNRCNFTASEPETITFTTDVTNTKPFHALYIHSNEQVSEFLPTQNTLTAQSVSGSSTTMQVAFNTTIANEFATKHDISSVNQLKVDVEFAKDVTGSLSPMIDGDRFGVVAVEYMANNANGAIEIEEPLSSSRLATNRSRYISRKVTLNDSANDMAVFVEGTFNGNSEIRVFVKKQGVDSPYSIFDDNPWIELYPDGIFPTPGIGTSQNFQALKPVGLVPGGVRFTTNLVNPGLGDYTQYQIKVVLLGQNPTNTGNATQVPILHSLAAVPLRKPTQDIIRRYIPVGSVIAYAAGPDIPPGFLLCDGRTLNYQENPEYKVLFDAIGYTHGGSGVTFNIPDLRGRTIIGVGQGSGLTSRNLADVGGAETAQFTLQDVNLPPHHHDFGRFAGLQDDNTDSGGENMLEVSGPNNNGDNGGSNIIARQAQTSRIIRAGDSEHTVLYNDGRAVNSFLAGSDTDGSFAGHAQLTNLMGLPVTNGTVQPFNALNYIIKI